MHVQGLETGAGDQGGACCCHRVVIGVVMVVRATAKCSRALREVDRVSEVRRNKEPGCANASESDYTLKSCKFTTFIKCRQRVVVASGPEIRGQPALIIAAVPV
jgi:hypothetical protein